MVSSTTRKIFSLAISLLVVVISLTGIALGATAPTVTLPATGQSRYTPGFKGAPGKMARDAAGNFYVADFWGKQIVKLNKNLGSPVYLPTSGRPTAVAALTDGRLVVVMSKPTSKVVFYSQVNGDEVSFGALLNSEAVFNPVAVTVDDAGYIYVLDSGDSSGVYANCIAVPKVFTDPGTANVAKVRVYSSAGEHKYSFGSRTGTNCSSTVGGEFKQPAGIAFETQSKNVVVVDTLNGRLQFFAKYDAQANTCNYVKSVGSPAGSATAGTSPGSIGSVVKFFNPVDVAFEYNGAQLYRAYVPQRARDEVAVVNVDIAGTYGAYLKLINSAAPAGANMKLPSSVLFEQTGGTGVGMLYVSNAATNVPANILALSIGSGSILPPTVALSIDPVPSISPSSPITVTGTTTPANSVTCTVNGGSIFPANGTATWDVSLPLTAGANHIICQSTSGGVTSFKETDTFLGALPQETVQITLPVLGLYTKASTVIVSGTTGSANAKVQLGTNNGKTASTTSGSNKNWSAVIDLLEGSNEITVTASKDGATSVSPAATVTVVADYTPPNMTGTISFLKDAAITNVAVQNIDGIVTDANISRIEINGVPIPSGAMVTLTPTTTYFSAPIILNRGKNTITVKAIDKANNSTTITRGAVGSEIVLKPEAPGITAALPADNSYLAAAAAITASGTADSGINSINAAGAVTAPAGGNWSTNAMNATAGFVSYQIDGSGPGLDTVTVKRTINTNASYQQVAITSPAADIATNASSVVIYGNVPANSTRPQIVINGVADGNVTNYVLASGLFDHTISTAGAVPLVQGLNSVKVISANGTTAVRNIIFDNTAPDLGLQADSAPMPTMITGSLEPSASITAVTANPGSVSIPLSRITYDTYDGSGTVIWHANLSGYSYTDVAFTAVDPAGNPSTLSYKKGVPTGDIDGDGSVRLADALAALRHVVGTEIIVDGAKFFNGDVGGLINGRAARDGVIDITDAQLILNKAYGLQNF